jgi:prepilin-type N-terminal cleavage/methylation domain-containing protein
MGHTIDRTHSEKGFTLIELMIVVAIIAFVTAAVVPSFSRSLAVGRQREAGNLVVQGVLAASSLAARTGRCHRVTIFLSDPGNFGGAVVVESSSITTRCGLADIEDEWNLVSVKCVACDGAPIAGVSRVSLVGDDVTLLSAEQFQGNGMSTGVVNQPGAITITFEPSGGMEISNLTFIEVVGETTSVSRWVTIEGSGSVRYGNKRI